MKPFSQLPSSLFQLSPEAPLQVTFRAARLSDLRALYEACFADRPLPQFGDGFRRSLEAQRAGQRLHLLALSQKNIVGSGQLVSYGHNVEIADLVVAPAFRGQGVGTALITTLSRVAAYAGYKAVEIGVMQENSRALTLYQRLGFVEDRHFTLGDSASVVVLRKTLR